MLQEGCQEGGHAAACVSSERYLCCAHLDAANDQQLSPPCSVNNQNGHYSPKHHASANLHSNDLVEQCSPTSQLPSAQVCARSGAYLCSIQQHQASMRQEMKAVHQCRPHGIHCTLSKEA